MSLMKASSEELKAELEVRRKIQVLRTKIETKYRYITQHQESIPEYIKKKEKRIQDLELQIEEISRELHNLEFPRKIEGVIE